MIWLILSEALATPWHLPNHNRRLRLDFETPANGAASNLPTLVTLNNNRVDYSVIRANGHALRFVDDQGNVLPMAIDEWDAFGQSLIWTRIPLVPTGGGGHIWLYYDGPPGLGDPSAPQDVWGGNWMGVWHLNSAQEATGRTSSFWDGNGNDNQDIPGAVGAGRDFDGNDRIEVTNSADSFDLDTLTVSAWVRRQNWSGDDQFAPIIAKGDSSWRLHRFDETDGVSFAYNQINSSSVDTDEVSIPSNTWVHIHASYNPNAELRVFVNGVERRAEPATGAIQNNNFLVHIGGNDEQDRFFDGQLDEIQVQQVARAPQWIVADHASQTDTLFVRWCDSVDSGLPGVVHDQDGDGVACDLDCDDADPNLGILETFYEDLDDDGYGNLNVTVEACAPPVGFSSEAQDCDDTNSDISPGASEICNGLDDDCDLVADNNATDAVAWYADADGDGWGDPDDSVLSCISLPNRVIDASDCDDEDAMVSPGETERCDGLDTDCDGLSDDDDDSLDLGSAPTWHEDFDGDTFGSQTQTVRACLAPPGFVEDGRDCDDTDSAISPDAQEVCDGLGEDEDCDGLVDDADPTVVGQVLFFPDQDSDGAGVGAGESFCVEPPGFAVTSDDCDDQDASVYPGAPELCDSLDNDCDGVTDDNTVNIDWFMDEDGDGFGDGLPTSDCSSPGHGFVSNSDDCDDMNPSINPYAVEVCDGVDNECDGVTDNGAVDATLTWPDADGDGFGDAASVPETECTPTGVENDDDCDDTDPLAWTDAPEFCDGSDNNCNGLLDADDPLLIEDGALWFEDSDGDGFGTGVGEAVCPIPPGWVASDGDCDDANPQVFPGASEVAGNGVDENCDGQDLPEDPGVDTDDPEGPSSTGQVTGCRCDSSGASWSLLGMLGLVAASRRSRRM